MTRGKLGKARQERSQEDDTGLTYGYHLVAFIDLLGQAERISKIEGALSSTQLDKEKLISILKQTVGTVRAFRNSFSSFLEQYSSHQPTIQVPEALKAKFRQLRGRSQINIHHFSDSTVVWTPVRFNTEIEYAHVLNSIYGVLGSVGMLTPLYLSVKVPFRGGIEIEGGISLSQSGNEIYGPALHCAYNLERRVAKYPRVVVGKGLLEFLDHVSAVRFQDDTLRAYRDRAVQRCRAWIVADEDGQSMIHFLGPAAMELVQDIPEGIAFHKNFVEPIDVFIHECEEQYKGDEKLGARYKHLRSYFDRYVGDWRK
jgi:hypothetical protein